MRSNGFSLWRFYAQVSGPPKGDGEGREGEVLEEQEFVIIEGKAVFPFLSIDRFSDV